MTTEIDAEGLLSAHLIALWQSHIIEARDAAVDDSLADEDPALFDRATIDIPLSIATLVFDEIANRRATTRTSEAEPVAWRVKDYADGWILIHDKHQAHEYAKAMGSLIEPLYTLYTHPTPASDDQVEAAAKALYEEDDPWNAAFPWPNPSDGPERAEAYRRLARAALAAMGSTKP